MSKHLQCVYIIADIGVTDRLTGKISEALRQKRKEMAMTYLRTRKSLEDVLKKRLASLELLHSTLLRVETSAGDIEVSVVGPE